MTQDPTLSGSSRENEGNLPLRALSFILLIIGWWLVSWIADSRVLPSPWTVADRLWQELRDGEMQGHLIATLRRVAFSFAIAMLIGTAIGMIMGSRRKMDVLLDGLLVLGLNVPALVVIILSYIWFGLTEVAAVLAVAANKIPMVIVNMREGARSVDRNLLDVARVYALPPSRTFRRVYLPQLTPYLLASMRNGLALIWKIVLVVELLGRSDGVGFQLGLLFQYFDIAGILAYTVAFVLVVYLIEWLILRPLDRRSRRWRRGS